MGQTTEPAYYRRGNIPVWDFIRDQGLNFHLGNAIKYICRAGHKDSYVQDLRKAIHYLENELQFVSRGRVPDKIQRPEQPLTTIHTAEFDR